MVQTFAVIALRIGVVAILLSGTASANARQSVEPAPPSATPTAEASSPSTREQLFLDSLKYDSDARRIYYGYRAVETLLRDAPTEDPDVALADGSVTVSAWSTNDESVSQAFEQRGNIYAITNHSRGYTGDDRFSVALVTGRGFHDLSLPNGVRVVDYESFSTSAPHVVLTRAGDEYQFAATISPDGVHLGKALPPMNVNAFMRERPTGRLCPSYEIAIRRSAAAASHGVSMNFDVDVKCRVVGDLGFVTLSQSDIGLTYVVDRHGYRAFSTWDPTFVGRDAILFQTSAPIEEGESSGFRNSYVLLRANSKFELPAPPGV